MPTEWVIAALVTAITVLSGALGTAIKLHLDGDARDRTESDQWKALAISLGADVAKLTPSVSSLSTAVEAEHRVAQDFRGAVDRKVDGIVGDIKQLLGKASR